MKKKKGEMKKGNVERKRDKMEDYFSTRVNS
jgi:hypothetical protein